MWLGLELIGLSGPHPYDSLLLIHELELFDCVFTPLTTSASLANDRVSLLLPAINIARYIFTETNETHMHISKLISDDKDRYIRWILAALSPWEGRAVVEKKKTLQAATVAARDGLKSRTKDCDIISHSYNHANEIHKLVEENSSDKLSELSRLTLGIFDIHCLFLDSAKVFNQQVRRSENWALNGDYKCLQACY